MSKDFIYYCVYYLLLVRCLVSNQILLNQTQISGLLVKNNLRTLTNEKINNIICEEIWSKQNSSEFNVLDNLFNNLSQQLLDKFISDESSFYKNINFHNKTEDIPENFYEDLKRKLINSSEVIIDGLIDSTVINFDPLLTMTNLSQVESQDFSKGINQFSCPNHVNAPQLLYWHLKNSIKEIFLRKENRTLTYMKNTNGKDASQSQDKSFKDFLDDYLSHLLNNYLISELEDGKNHTLNHEVYRNQLNDFLIPDTSVSFLNAQPIETFISEVIENELEYSGMYNKSENNSLLITNRKTSSNNNEERKDVYSEDPIDDENEFDENIEVEDSEKRTKNIKLRFETIVIPFEKDKCWYAYNKLRILHQVKRLKWHEGLAQGAQEWALHLAIQNKGTRHSSFYDEKGRKYGETIYRYKGDHQRHCRSAIFRWYGESEGYRFKKNKNIYVSGHFMQIVWKNTRYFGVGIAYAHGKTWIVARYFPASYTAVKKSGDVKKRRIFGEERIKAKNLVSSHRHRRWLQSVQVIFSGEKDCYNKDVYCNYYKQMGKCAEKSTRRNCPKSCGICSKGPRVNGGFTRWVKTEGCSTDCGVGRRKEHRYCVNPEPMNGGAKCRGKKIRKIKCKDYTCRRMKMSCADKDPNCFHLLKNGYCSKKNHIPYMKKNCKMSCGSCRNCHRSFDGDTCLKYAMRKNYCHLKSQLPFMSKNCQAFCCEYNHFLLSSGKNLMQRLVRSEA